MRLTNTRSIDTDLIRKYFRQIREYARGYREGLAAGLELLNSTSLIVGCQYLSQNINIYIYINITKQYNCILSCIFILLFIVVIIIYLYILFCASALLCCFSAFNIFINIFWVT